MSLPILLPLIVTLAGSMPADGRDERAFDRSVAARGIDRVEVRLVAGSIKVLTSSSGQIGLHAVRRVEGGTHEERRRVLEESRMDLVTRGGRLTIQDVPSRSARSSRLNTSVQLEIQLPESTTLDLHTDAGEITVSGSAGEVSAGTGAGTIRLTNLRSQGKTVQAETGAGSITINGRTGDLKVKAGAGDVILDNLACSGRHTTVDVATGSIRADLDRMPSQGIILAAGVGPVTLSLPQGTRPVLTADSRAEGLRRVGGSLTGKIANGATFRLSTGVGPVRIR